MTAPPAASPLRSITVALPTNPYPVVIGAGALGGLGEQIRQRNFPSGTKVLEESRVTLPFWVRAACVDSFSNTVMTSPT